MANILSDKAVDISEKVGAVKSYAQISLQIL